MLEVSGTMDRYTVPDYVTSRLRFYNGQFLRDDDFIDEQRYHVSQARRHERLLHVSGVVEGLVVTAPGGIGVKVSPGSAIDAKGRVIVLQAEQTVNAPGDGTFFVEISFAEVESHPADPNSPIIANTRFSLATSTIAVVTSTARGGEAVTLAKIVVTSGNAAVLTSSARVYSGVALPGPAGASYALRAKGDTAMGFAELGASLSVAGDLLAVNGTLSGAFKAASATITGALGAGSTSVTGTLSVSGALGAASASIGGDLLAVNGTLSGALKAASATITGALGAGSTSVTGTLSVSSALSAASASIGGDVTAVNGTLSGALKAASATITGALSTGSATVSGALSAASAGIGGDVTAVNGTLSGALKAASATITGALGAASATVTNGLTAGTATVTNGLTAANATVTNTVSAGSANVSGNLSVSGNVGFGTTAPKARLQVVGDIILGADANNQKFILHPRAAEGGDVLQITNDLPDGNADWSNGIVLKRGGNVGIGIFTPSVKLDVGGDINYAGQLTKLDVAPSFQAVVRVTDFRLGNHGATGRAFVDATSQLVVNWGGDWATTRIGSSLFIDGMLTLTSAAANADILVNAPVRSTLCPAGSNVPANLAFQVRSAGTGDLQLNTDNPGNVVLAQGGGNVGVGVAPTAKLHVLGVGSIGASIVGGTGPAGARFNPNGWSLTNALEARAAGGDAPPAVVFHHVGLATLGLVAQSSPRGLRLTGPSEEAKPGLYVDGEVMVRGTGRAVACNEESLRTLRGVIGPSGAVLSGAGFTVTKPLTGVYDVTFNVAFSSMPTVVVTQMYNGDLGYSAGNTLDNAVVVGVSITKARFKIGDAGGNGADRHFHFIVVGS
ncbi:Flagellar hook-length control protein FliK [Minicystis rosea]|nr:Flagellar hook-length control protein FliK [Minicystis rosea]